MKDITKCANSSVCQWSLERPDDIFDLGQFIYDPFTIKEANGFYAAFGTGQTIINKFTNESCNVTFTIEFDCDANVPWNVEGVTGFAPDPLEFSGISETSCDVSNTKKR